MSAIKDDDRGLHPECKPDMAATTDQSQRQTVASPDPYHSLPPAKLREDMEATNLLAIEKHKADFLNHLERRNILLAMQKKMDVIESLQDRLINTMIDTCHRPESGEGLANITLHTPSPDPNLSELFSRNEATSETASPPISPYKESVHKDGMVKGRQPSDTALKPLVKYAELQQNLTPNPPSVPLQIVGQRVKNTRKSRTNMDINECASENLESWQKRGGNHGVRSLIDIKKKLDDANISKAPVYVEEKVEIPRRTVNLLIETKAPVEKLIHPPGPVPKIKAAQRLKEKTTEIKNRYQNPNTCTIERDKEYCPLVNSYGSDQRSNVLPIYKNIKKQKDAISKRAEPAVSDYYRKFANDKLPTIRRQNDIENFAKKERMLYGSIPPNGHQKQKSHNLTPITREKEVRNFATQKLVPTLCPIDKHKVTKNSLMPHTTQNIHQKPNDSRMHNNAEKQKTGHLTSISLPPIAKTDNRYTADNRQFRKGKTLPGLDSNPKTLHDFYDKNVGLNDGYCLSIPKPRQKVRIEEASLNGHCKLPPIVQKCKGSQRRQR